MGFDGVYLILNCWGSDRKISFVKYFGNVIYSILMID